MSGSAQPHQLLLILLLGALSALTPLAIDMYLPSIPTMATEWAVPVESVQYSVSLYLLGFAFGQLLYGPLTDSFGRLPVMLAGLSVFALASIACAMSQSNEQLLLARFVQAIGGAGSAVVVLALLRDIYGKDQFAKAMSMVMLVMNLAPLLAPMLGGYLLLFFGWRSIFWCLAGVSVLLMISMVFTIKETLPKAERTTLSLCNVLLTYGAILRHRACMSYQLISIGASGMLFAFITGSSFVYIEYFQVPAHHFGYYFSANIILMMALTSLNARYVSRFGSEKMLGAALLLAIIGAVLLITIQLLNIGGVWGVVIPVLLMMGPMGVISANSAALSMNSYDGASGSVAAMGGFLRFVFGATVGGIMGVVHTQSPWAMIGAMVGAIFVSVMAYLWARRVTVAA